MNLFLKAKKKRSLKIEVVRNLSKVLQVQIRNSKKVEKHCIIKQTPVTELLTKILPWISICFWKLIIGSYNYILSTLVYSIGSQFIFPIPWGFNTVKYTIFAMRVRPTVCIGLTREQKRQRWSFRVWWTIKADFFNCANTKIITAKQ